MPTAELVPFESITVDGDTQMRLDISADLILSLSEAFKNDEPVPAIDLFEDDKGRRWVGDGLHRVAGCRKAKKKWLLANIHKGTKRDAILFAAGANRGHDQSGLRRTNADKRHAVKVLLKDAEWGQRSTAWIAEACAVSQGLVEEIRTDFSTSDSGGSSKSENSRTGRDGSKRKQRKKVAPKTGEDGEEEIGADSSQKPTKNGLIVVDWLKEFKDRFGPLVRFQDDIVRAGQGHPGEKCSSEYYAYGRLLKELLGVAERWWKKIKAQKKGAK